MGQGGQQFTISAEVTVEVTDMAGLQQAALQRLNTTQFLPDDRRSADEVRADARDEIEEDIAAALDWVTDADAILTVVDGVQVTSSQISIGEAGDDAADEDQQWPDFAALFPVCQCDAEDCETCSGFQMTPRTAAALWSVAQVHADFAYDDVQQHGDDPVTDDDAWAAFNEYPRITWTQDAVWRRQAARAFDDLTADLAAGHLPSPTCPGEEMALHLMLQSAQAAIADGWGPPPELLSSLPEVAGDYDWDLAEEVLLQDDDILSLFDVQMDGIEDPESEANRTAGMGDYRPAAWFRTFNNMTPRDGRRRFRR
ncbi:hypothetical protein ACQP2F_32780 [Actinoplanes sp. CA-030573]|uniref:hypothetical protein n=1 Tax=Actinoplanes sp. CA-030573 TaxID=3239898 RepID=UPI003D926A7C